MVQLAVTSTSVFESIAIGGDFTLTSGSLELDVNGVTTGGLLDNIFTYNTIAGTWTAVTLANNSAKSFTPFVDYNTNNMDVFLNTAPTGTIANFSVDEDAPDTVIDLAAAFADEEHTDAQITYSIQGNTNSTLVSLTLDNTGDQLTLDYAENLSGSSTITVRATDPRGQFTDVAFTVTVNPVNDVPVIANLGGDTLSYSEGDGSVAIDQPSNAAVTDIDSSNFDTGTLTVAFTAGSDNAEDVLAIINTGTGTDEIGISGSNVTFEGTTIGTFTGGSNGNNLVITLNASANAAAVSALTQQISYQNTDTDNPTTGDRTARFVLTDGDGGTSPNYDTTISVSAVNDAPVITGGPDSVGLTETNAGLNSTGELTVTDVDTADSVTASVDSVAVAGTGSTSAPAALDNDALKAFLTVAPTAILDNTDTTATLTWNFNSGSEAFNFLAQGETLILTYTVKATDDAGTPLSDNETVTVTITGTNDTPAVTVVDVVGDVTEDASTPNLTDSGSVTFAELDESDVVTSSVAIKSTTTTGPTVPTGLQTALNTAVSLNQTGTNDGSIAWNFSVGNDLTQYLADGETVTATYTITVTDDSGTGTNSSTQDVTVTITGTNDTPVAQAGTNTAAEDGAVVNGQLTETDADVNDTHTYALINNTSEGSATVNSDGSYTFDPGSGFQDLAEGETRDVTFRYEVTDNHGATSQADVTITVSGTSEAPVITGGPDSVGLTETNAGLASTGELTVTDVDTTDNVTAAVDSVVVTGTGSSSVPASLTDTTLQNFLTLTPTAILNNTQTSATLTWNFNSGSEAFDFLANGETLILTYTVSATDDSSVQLSDTETVIVTITGTNDAPSPTPIL